MSTNMQRVGNLQHKQKIDLGLLGSNVRFLRQGRGWSLADLSNASGVGKAYISDLENGEAGKPNIQYVFSIGRALDVTLDRLLEGAVPTDVPSKSTNQVTELPPGLADFKKEKSLSDEEVQMLAQVNFRGNRPKDVDGWRFLYQTIKMLGERSAAK